MTWDSNWDKQKTIDRVFALTKHRVENPQSVMDYATGYIVMWSEIFPMMKEDGYTGGVVAGRHDWEDATKDIEWPDHDRTEVEDTSWHTKSVFDDLPPEEEDLDWLTKNKG